MSIDTPFGAEFSYKRKREGKRRIIAALLLAMYVAFGMLFFLFCYITRFIPLFAISPIAISMLVYFTWSRSLPDVYYEFRAGMLSVGTVRGRQRVHREKYRIHVKDAERIFHVGRGRVELDSDISVSDMSSSMTCEERVGIVFSDGGRRAVILDTTPELVRVLTSFSKNSGELSDYLKSK